MAQHDYNIANQSGAAFRADLNNALAAIVSNNSGAVEPSTTYAYQFWADTTAGVLKQRNAANSAWVTIGTLADPNLGLLSRAGGTMTGLITFAAGQTFPAVANYQEFTSNGTWTKPTSCTIVYVELVGGGGGGGSGARRATTSARGGGSGGAGGAGLYKFFRASDLTATVSVTVGAGGSGSPGITTNDTNGWNSAGDGGNTQFGTYLASGSASGGNGGSIAGFSGASVSYKAIAGFNAGVGGNSGIIVTSNGGSLAFPFGGAGGGGGGGAASNSLTTLAGGTGGFNAVLRSSSAAIAAGQNAPVNEGGGGGGGSYVTATNGMEGGDGAFPGGGGGGGSASDNGFISGAGGNGAAGVVRVWSW